MYADETVTRLRKAGVIAILRRMPDEKLMAVAEAAVAGGVEAIEITLDSPGAIAGIAALRRLYGEKLLVGAGTLMSAAQATACVEAGAQFLVSPHVDASLMQAAQDLRCLMIPGILTPTEIVQAEKMGASVLKLFPAGAFGAQYLKDLLGPFHGKAFIPTGGITEENAPDFVRAGALAVGMGSALVGRAHVEGRQWGKIADHVRAVKASVRLAREMS